MTRENRIGLLDRTLCNLRNAWQGITGSDYDADAASSHPDLPDEHAERLRKQLMTLVDRDPDSDLMSVEDDLKSLLAT